MKALLLLVVVCLQGCAGFGIYATQTAKDTEHPIGQPKFAVLEKGHQYWGENGYEKIPPTFETIKGLETVTYTRPKEWCGGLVVIVPLMLPVCTEEDVYYFKDEKLVSHTQQRVTFNGVLCSIFPACSGGSDCTLCIVE